jgi:hypothetical protein
MPTFVGMTRRHGPRVDLNADWYYTTENEC